MSAKDEPNAPDPMCRPLPADEILYPVPEAFERLTGRRPSPASCHRWRLRGVNGVRLETTKFGGQRMCTTRNAKAFLDASTRAADGARPAPPPAQANRQAEARIAAAERDLESAGA